MTSPLTIQNERGHLPVADGLRGFAMMLVVGYHVVNAIPTLLRTVKFSTFLMGGAIGVPFFFVISGFLLHLHAARRDGDIGSVRSYAERRFVRLMPAYWFMLAALLFVWPFVFDVVSPAATKDGVRGLLVHLVLLQQLMLGSVKNGFVADIGFGVNGAVWSLTTEGVFYVLFPIICGVFHRHPRASVASAFVITVVWRFAAGHTDDIASVLRIPRPEPWLGDFLCLQLPGHAWSFAAGMFAAELYVQSRGHPFFGGWVATGLQVACALGLLACVYAAGLDPEARTFFKYYVRDSIPSVLLAMLLVLASHGTDRAAWPYSNALSRFLGDVSYGAFLWHMVLIQIFWRAFDLTQLGATRGTFVLTVLVVPTALAAGYLSRRFIERPLVRFLRERQAKRGVKLVAASSVG